MEQNVNSSMQGVGLLMIVFSFLKKSFYVIYIFYVHFLKWVFILFVVRKKSKKGEKRASFLKAFLGCKYCFPELSSSIISGHRGDRKTETSWKKKRIKDLSFSTFHLHPRRADWLNFVLQSEKKSIRCKGKKYLTGFGREVDIWKISYKTINTVNSQLIHLFIPSVTVYWTLEDSNILADR